jgi:hypothetical protein
MTFHPTGPVNVKLNGLDGPTWLLFAELYDVYMFGVRMVSVLVTLP